MEEEGDEGGNRSPLPSNSMHALISNSSGLGVVSDMSKDVVTSVVNKRQSVMEQLVLEKKIEELKGQKSDLQEQG